MSFMNFLNKYKNTETDVEAPQVGESGAARGNRAAAQQQTEISAMQTQEARRLGATEQLMAGERKAKQFQADQQIEGMRQESSARKQKFKLATDEISSQLKRDMNNLSEQEKLDRMEAYAQTLRVQNDKYVTQLQNEGKIRRLNDANEFDMAMKESVFEDELDMLRDNIAFQQILDADEATFLRSISAMDINSALELARDTAKAGSRQALGQGITQAATSGAGWWASRTPSEEPETDTTFRMRGVEGGTQSPFDLGDSPYSPTTNYVERR